MAWRTRSSSVVYENRWISVREDAVITPDGGDGIYGVVTVRQPAVFIVAMTEADEVVLITVDRHTTGASVEVPAGGAEDEDPLAAAQRELREETGLVAHQWVQVGQMDALNGICRAPETVFLATGLTAADEGLGRSEEGISQVRRVPVPEVLELVRSGGIGDGETIAALMLALVHLGRIG